MTSGENTAQKYKQAMLKFARIACHFMSAQGFSVNHKVLKVVCSERVANQKGQVVTRSYGGSEVTCRKPDTFLLAATFAASFTASLILVRLLLRV